MTDQQRHRIGVIGVTVGSLILIAGVLIAHFTNLPTHDSVGREIYSWIPRCAFFEGDPTRCWVYPILGEATAFLGSQIAMAAIWFGWIYKRPLTWALATVGAFLFTLEMILLFGVVPNQWLNLTQGTLEWTEQKIFFTIPRWLVLNNTVRISYAVLKDLILWGYASNVLVVMAVAAYMGQERAKRAGIPEPPGTSVYGRPVVKGGR